MTPPPRRWSMPPLILPGWTRERRLRSEPWVSTALPAERSEAVSRDHAAPRIEILPVLGIGELRPGDDLAALIAEHAPPLEDGDVLVVTSKAVSKVEGRLGLVGTADGDAREATRQEAIDAETVRVVASRGALRIVETRQ